MQKDIYPIIANKYHRSINNIKTSIALSIKMMCIDCKDDILKEYFYLYDSEVPKIKEVICIIFENIINKKDILNKDIFFMLKIKIISTNNFSGCGINEIFNNFIRIFIR